MRSTASSATDPAKRERAALDVLNLLPELWAVGPTSYDPGTGRWTWTACGRHPVEASNPRRSPENRRRQKAGGSRPTSWGG